MKRLLAFFYYVLARFLISLRYKIEVKGEGLLTPERLSKPGGILFLANHPAEIDPLILLLTFWRKFKLHPVALAYLFRTPVVGYLLEFIGALPVPNFDASSNSFKQKQIDKIYEKIFSLLKEGENILIYPAGGLKEGGEEVIGGTSGVHTLLNRVPETNVVLIRSIGLWGSSFSKALTGKTPDLKGTFLAGFKTILKNFIFFTPRRKVLIECEPAPADFPWKGERRTLNQYLESWYNRGGAEPLYLVSSLFWRKNLPTPYERPPIEELDTSSVPAEVKNQVYEEIKKLMRHSVELKPELHLSQDLGLDSLDMAQLAVFLKDAFGIGNILSNQLTTVGSVLAYASKQLHTESTEEIEGTEQVTWKEVLNRPPLLYPEVPTLLEAFLQTCTRLGSYEACADPFAGRPISYKKLKLAILLFAEKIKKLPGKQVGIMLPASLAVHVTILATMLAGKIPVMINWTLGERNLNSVVTQSGIKVTLTSWNFVDRLENIDLNGLDEQLLFLEDMRRSFSIGDKIRALFHLIKNPKRLLKAFGVEGVKGEEPAVILFTSGTESLPKGVPLSHENLMANQKAALSVIEVSNQDVLLGVLPPFHSFGFSVTGLFPLIAGLRVVYSPNPTDGRNLASTIKLWGVTLICLAPTFIKNLVRVAKLDHLNNIRYVVSGAEKMPADLPPKIQSINPQIQVLEGYGITECGPILTLNPPGRPSIGVGKPLPGVEILVVDPETYIPRSTLQEPGLILARGPNIFAGYLNPALSSPFVEVAGKAWYVTGDLGFLTEEGHLILSGRLKRFIKIGGEMISLGAVEEVLLQAAPAQGWSLDPDHPSLAVIAQEEEGKKGEIHLFTTFKTTIEEINRILKENGMSNLIRVKSVTHVSFIPELGTGKVDYRKLSQQTL